MLCDLLVISGWIRKGPLLNHKPWGIQKKGREEAHTLWSNFPLLLCLMTLLLWQIIWEFIFLRFCVCSFVVYVQIFTITHTLCECLSVWKLVLVHPCQYLHKANRSVSAHISLFARISFFESGKEKADSNKPEAVNPDRKKAKTRLSWRTAARNNLHKLLFHLREAQQKF